ncbi:MAG: glycosyltransferase [Pseudomonadota bacterium]
MTTGPSYILKQSQLPRVVWDGLGLLNTHSGVGNYGANLYKNLEHLGISPEVTAQTGRLPGFVTSARGIILPPTLLGRKFQAFKPSFPVYSYRAAINQHQKIIYHGLSNINLPCFGRLRSSDKFVITIHDIIPILTGKNSALGLQFRWLMPRVLERADRVITGSNWARDSILEVFGARYSEKIEAVGYGTAKTSNIPSTEPSIDCLTIARGESYKRLELITSIARNCPARQFAVVTDQAGVSRMGHLPTNIKTYSGLDDERLSKLLLSARALLQPSLFEGWCLPAAAALNSGLYVIYCSGSGIDEVCAHAPEQAVALSPEKTTDDWSEALNGVLRRPKTTSPLINLPTWEEVAQKTLKIYQSLV